MGSITEAWRPRKDMLPGVPALPFRRRPRAMTVPAMPKGKMEALGMDAASVDVRRGVDKLVNRARSGLDSGASFELEGAGTGGAYRLQTQWGQPVAILKPRDEEAFAENNPRGLRSPIGSTAGFRSGAVKPGTGADREAAAFLLDHGNFAGVPATALVKVQHPGLASGDNQEASLQDFVTHRGPASDYSPSLFSVRTVHRIAQLDLRLINLDRNDSNLLVTGEQGQFELIPIDHGLCLPEKVAMTTDGIAWMSWPSAKEQWDANVLAYVLSVDASADLDLMTTCGKIGERNCLLAWAATRLLQLSAVATPAWTPFDVGSAVYRPDFDIPSGLEECLLFAEQSVGPAGLQQVESTPVANYSRIPRYLGGHGLWPTEDDLECSLDASYTTLNLDLDLRPQTPRARSSNDVGEASPASTRTPSPRTSYFLDEHLVSGPRTDQIKAYVEIALKQLIAAGPDAASGGVFLL